jgi:hypothetical protein
MTNSGSAPQQESKATPRNQPVHHIRMSRIEAAIWQNQSENGTWYNVTLSRSYKDGNDEWKSADSFSADDLLLVAKVADEAHSWIIQKQQDRNP